MSTHDRHQGPGVSREWLFAIALLMPAVVCMFAATYPWASATTLLLDPFKLSEKIGSLHPLMGALSTCGAIAFFGSAVVALFGATLTAESRSRSFLVYAGVFSSVLATDDFFGLHDRVLPELGVMERYVKTAYLVGQAVYITAFYKVIRRLNYLLLLASMVLFFVSLAFDNPMMRVVQNELLDTPLSPNAREAWEDIPKLAGTLLWLWFHMRAARQIVLESYAQKFLSDEDNSETRPDTNG